MSNNKKPRCRLTMVDGNVFSIIGTVRSALQRAGRSDEAKEFSAKAFKSASYDAVLALCFDYVEVE